MAGVKQYGKDLNPAVDQDKSIEWLYEFYEAVLKNVIKMELFP